MSAAVASVESVVSFVVGIAVAVVGYVVEVACDAYVEMQVSFYHLSQLPRTRIHTGLSSIFGPPGYVFVCVCVCVLGNKDYWF